MQGKWEEKKLPYKASCDKPLRHGGAQATERSLHPPALPHSVWGSRWAVRSLQGQGNDFALTFCHTRLPPPSNTTSFGELRPPQRCRSKQWLWEKPRCIPTPETSGGRQGHSQNDNLPGDSPNRCFWDSSPFLRTAAVPCHTRSGHRGGQGLEVAPWFMSSRAMPCSPPALHGAQARGAADLVFQYLFLGRLSLLEGIGSRQVEKSLKYYFITQKVFKARSRVLVTMPNVGIKSM